MTKSNALIAKIAGAGVLAATVSQVAMAADCAPGNDPLRNGINCSRPAGVSDTLFGGGSIFERIANLLIFFVGAIAVIMLIVGGLTYVLSQGNKDRVETAKNTILYAIIGIIVATLAFAAVRFVANQIR